jgi:hypothetical protein
MHTARPLPGAVILLLGALGVVAGVILIFCWVDNARPARSTMRQRRGRRARHCRTGADAATSRS